MSSGHFITGWSGFERKISHGWHFNACCCLLRYKLLLRKKDLKVGNTFLTMSNLAIQMAQPYKKCWWSFIWLYLQGFVFQCEYLWYIGYNSKYITKKININQFGCPYPRIVYLHRLGFYQCTWMEHLTDMIHTIWMCRSICHTHKY